MEPGDLSFRGPAIYDGKKYQKLDVEKPDADQLPKAPITGGWAAAMQHHFVAAIVPDAGDAGRLRARRQGHDFQLRVAGPVREAAPGGTADFKDTLFVGPKLQDAARGHRARARPHRRLRPLTILAQPLFWMLAQVHRIVGNWGFTIIIVTFLIKLLLLPARARPAAARWRRCAASRRG